jgi:hypothetical protein
MKHCPGYYFCKQKALYLNFSLKVKTSLQVDATVPTEFTVKYFLMVPTEINKTFTNFHVTYTAAFRNHRYFNWNSDTSTLPLWSAGERWKPNDSYNRNDCHNSNIHDYYCCPHTYHEVSAKPSKF